MKMQNYRKMQYENMKYPHPNTHINAHIYKIQAKV